MNKDNRIYRTLAAAKHAFFEKPPTQQQDNAQPDNKAAAPAPKPVETVVKPVDEGSKILLNDPPKTVNDLSKDYCTGCTACCNVCPVDAITMQFNDRGYSNPVIDADKCIGCTKCEKTCPVINTKYENSPEPECYAVMASDEIRTNSSSGGMFTLAAENILDKGGYVCGAAFTDNFKLEHIIISDKNELYRMRGSKYTQSLLGNVFKDIRSLLEDGKTVLFSGCPCQVAGLHNYLGKNYDSLYTLDLVCHGAPPQPVFHKYLDEYYGRDKLEDFRFRTKEFGYNSFHQTAYLKNGEKISGNIRFDPYEKAMHSGLTLMDVCADCMFASAPRQGDISIGDFWGIAKYDQALNDNLGTSVALVNNAKGKQLFDEITQNAKMVNEVPFSFARSNNRFGRKMKMPINGRKWFYELIKGNSFEKSVNYAVNRHFDIGVIGLWYGRNYGSMATYFALHQVLTEKFHLSVLMIENPLKPAASEISRSHPRNVADMFYDVSLQYPLTELNKLNNFCDAFIVGSDQLWNVGLSRPYKQMYYLDFVNNNIKKIAYGTSFGKDYAGTSEEKLLSSHNLRRFDHVSVRDKLSLEIARDQFGVKDVVDVCDPTFLCPLSEYQKLVDIAELEEPEPYILAYFLDPNDLIGKELENIAEASGCKIVAILDEPPWVWEKNKEKLALAPETKIDVKCEVTLQEWLWYYSHAKAVATDSFHGTIFSIIYKKPFITLINKKRGAQRFISLLEPLGLRERLLDTPQQLSENMGMLDELDYNEPDKKLDEIRSKSMSWLENALFSPKKYNSYCSYAAYDKRMEDMK